MVEGIDLKDVIELKDMLKEDLEVRKFGFGILDDFCIFEKGEIFM